MNVLGASPISKVKGQEKISRPTTRPTAKNVTPLSKSKISTKPRGKIKIKKEMAEEIKREADFDDSIRKEGDDMDTDTANVTLLVRS